MDKLKEVLALAKKHHFWVLFGVVVVLAAVVWFSASSGLADRIESRTGDLENTRQQVSGVSSTNQHPNSKCLDAIQAENQRLRNEVFKAWQRLYQDQKDRNKWPSTLGDRFLTVINALEFYDPIPEPQRANYMYFIENHFQTLYDIIDIRLSVQKDERGNIVKDEDGKPKKIDPLAKQTAAGGYGAQETDYGSMDMDYGGMETDYGQNQYEMYSQSAYSGSGASQKGELVGKVFWNTANIQQLWRRLHWNDTPTDSQVWLAQEDLWVFEALLRIVAETNEGATSYYNAAVKRIEAIQIGQDVALSGARGGGPGGPFGYPGGGDAGYGSDMMRSEEEYDYQDDMDSMRSEDGEAPGDTTYGSSPTDTTAMSLDQRLRIELTDNRYVDRKGKPLPVGDDGRVEHPFEQFKMMPVRMLLVMDQRRIPRLLVKCANSAMPVVVRRVRLNPGKGRSFDPTRMMGPRGPGGPGALGSPFASPGAGYFSGDSGYESDYDSDYPDAGGYGGYQSGQYGQSADRGKQPGSFDLPVEVQGIIYFFNRPKYETLAGDAAGAEPAPPSAPDTEPADGDAGNS